MNVDVMKEFSPGLLLKVEQELQRAKKRFPNKIHSLHEGYGIILEELEEFWVEIKKKESDRDPGKLTEEGVHLIAMVIRTLQDLVIENNE